jgi:hypothetical protein
MSDKAAKQAYDPATYRSHSRLGITTDVFSSNIPHRAPLLCYIAGIECPIVAADVSYGVWKIPEATISMFPDPQLQRFGAEDRVPVALFYLDEYIDQNNPTWRLLFEGEIVGWSYTNTVGSRSLQFNCVMNIAMWTQLFIFYMTSLSSVASGVVATSNNPAAIAQAQAVPGFSLFRQGLLIPPKGKQAKGASEDYIKRPYDLAYNVVRSLISKKVPEKQRCVPGINFFARWSRREQFHNRWVAIPFLEEPTTERQGKEVVETGVPGIFPVLRAAQSLQAVRAVENYIAEKYSGGSIYTILKQVLDTVLMEMVMLPTAPCVQTRTDGVIKGPPVFRTAAQKVNVQTQEKITAAAAVLQAELDALDKAKAAAKKPSKDNIAKAKAAKKESITDSNAHTKKILDALAVAGVTVKGLVSDIGPAEYAEGLLRLLPKGISSAISDKGPKDASLPVRLGNYFIKPQMLFGLPPNCNVVFPSMTPQITYHENYVTQPTRFYLQDDSALQYAGFANPQNVAMKDVLLSALSRAYPPEVDKKWVAHMQKGQGAKSGRNLLVWPEEFFKGPVTARQPAPPWLMFVAAQTQAAGHKTGSKVGTANAKSTKADATKANDRDKGALTDQDVYALYAQYEYFRHRFAARNGAVACMFHPYVVPGFPLAVFDDFQSRMHTIGYLMNVTHQFSNRSVATSLNYGYGRTLYEFFDLIGNEIDTGGAIADRKNLAMAAAPAEPIKEIRDVTQHFHKAEQFYQALLHRRQPVHAVFEYRDLIAFVDGKGALENIQIEGLNEEAFARLVTDLEAAKAKLTKLSQNKPVKVREGTSNETVFSGGLATYHKLSATDRKDLEDAFILAGFSAEALSDMANTTTGANPQRMKIALDNLDKKIASAKKQTGQKVTHNLRDAISREIAPKPGAEPYFDSYDAAMTYCARPICTLDEYIEFIRGIKEGPQDDVAYVDGSRVPSARYYARIRKMIGAPAGFKPTDAQQGTDQTGKVAAVNLKDEPTFPELRAQWEKSLLAYRRNVYTTTEVQR